MNTAVSLDSFQLIIGIYFLYVSIKGHGTLYNFSDISEEMQIAVKPKLRILYAVCALLALGEAGLCIWASGSGQAAISADAVTAISSATTIGIILILAGVFIWLRKLAAKSK